MPPAFAASVEVYQAVKLGEEHTGDDTTDEEMHPFILPFHKSDCNIFDINYNNPNLPVGSLQNIHGNICYHLAKKMVVPLQVNKTRKLWLKESQKELLGSVKLIGN